MKEKVFGVIGDPIGHSLSPDIHNRAFQARNLPCFYAPFHVKRKELAAALQGLRALGIGGVNVTIPHKEACIEFLDEVKGAAAQIRAVNTIVQREGQLVGYNTDVSGFAQSLQARGLTMKRRRVAILGSGGAARAVGLAAVMDGAAEVRVFARNPDRSKALAVDLAAIAADGVSQNLAGSEAGPKGPVAVRCYEWGDWSSALSECELIVNATPLGMQGVGGCPLPEAVLQPHQAVYDLVYNPIETPLLRRAAARGCQAVSGLEMLVYQGAIAFELFTGVEAPVEDMREAARERLRAANDS